MRIIAGKNKGRKLKTLSGSKIVRPTKDIVKEAIFNILFNYPENKICLDLFAGFGSLGLEALSRGAAKVDFVEINPKNCKIISENIRLLEGEDSCQVYCQEVISYLQKTANKYQLVFLDPPYDYGQYQEVLFYLLKNNLLINPAIIVLEHAPEKTFKEISNYLFLKNANYGDSAVTLLEYQGLTEEEDSYGKE